MRMGITKNLILEEASQYHCNKCEDLISFETAKLCKEKGIVIPYTNYAYSSDGKDLFRIWDEREKPERNWKDKIPVYGLHVLQKWLREVHKIEIAVQWFDKGYIKAVKKHPFKNNTYRMETWNSYEEALEMALFEALNLISDEGNNK